jgi:hypothetical protein
VSPWASLEGRPFLEMAFPDPVDPVEAVDDSADLVRSERTTLFPLGTGLGGSSCRVARDESLGNREGDRPRNDAVQAPRIRN